MSLSKKTLTGALWSMAELFAVRSITLLVTLILAYFLSPVDFGLVAMMAVFIAIASSLMDSGFRQALIRLPETRQEDLSTAFYANLFLGFLSYLLIFFSAPLIAGFYAEPQLILLIRMAALVVVINAFQVVQYSVLSRQLNFRAQFKAALPASAFSAMIAVMIAYAGYGVWALIAQMLAAAFFRALLIWWQGIWRPRWIFRKASFIRMYKFGYKLFLADILDIVFRNLYVVVIAKAFSISVAGVYFFVDKMREVVMLNIVISIHNVTYPALAKISNDNDRLKSGYRKSLSVTMFLISPIILFMAALAEPLFKTFLPETWWSGVRYLQLMCLGGVLIPLHALNLNILKVKGRSDLSLLVEIIKKIIMAIILFFSISFGIYGILIGQVLNSVLDVFVNSLFSKRLLEYSGLEQLVDASPTLLLSGGIAGILFWLQAFLNWSSYIELIILGLLGVGLYLWLSVMIKLESVSILLQLIRTKNKKDIYEYAD